VNYIGSKYSLLDFIDSVVSEFTDSHSRQVVICDAFAGTGAVGVFFRRKGHKVIANDIQYYSYVINKNLIENPPLNLVKLDYLNNLEPIEGFIYQTYCAGSGSGRMYFSDENGKRCDAIRQEIERMKTAGEIDEHEYYAYLAALIEAIDKVANTASVYGAFLKSLKKSAQKPMKLVQIPSSDTVEGKVYNSDINTLINKISGDILYLDPPYNTRQYSSNYHLLETIARYDSPEVRGKTGLRETTAQKSKYSSKRTVVAEFEEIIKNAKFKVVILSYNNEGLMSVDAVREIMSKYGEYYLREKEYRRFKADKTENRNHKASGTKEYLHVLVKRDA
jgi:adenine-specific DNA-methyltransferase